MIPLRDNLFSREAPRVTYTLAGLNLIVYLWDRGWNWAALNGYGIVFSDLALRPAEVVAALSGRGDPASLTTLFTAMFLHGNLAHLVGNLLFLITFGDNVEQVLGPVRYTLYYLFWGFLAASAHIFVEPGSMVPMLGASGAIGGVLGAYLLLFPGNRITFVVFPIIFYPFKLAAWVLLGVWFAFQIVIPQEGVANWAHVGGFLAGMVTVAMMGGREKALQGVKLERVADDEGF